MAEASRLEGRRHARFGGGEYPLRIGRCSARLLDWSASGIGLQVKEGISGFAAGDPAELGIVNDTILAVVAFTGRIQHVDPGRRVIGIEFLSGGETIIPILVELLGEPLETERF